MRKPIELDLSMRAKLITRIERYAVPLPSGCIEWSGQHSKDGYAAMIVKTTSGKWQPAKVHRVMYLLCGNDDPGTRLLHHICHNRGCINPDHVEPKASQKAHSAEHRQAVCKNGHPLEGDNILLTKDGRRRCKICAAARQSLWLRKKRLFHRGPWKTHCKHGHPWIKENIRVKKNGHRECRICHREQQLRRYHEKKAAEG